VIKVNALIKYIVDYEDQRLELMGRPDVQSNYQVMATIFVNPMLSTERRRTGRGTTIMNA
jgi:hypothetical protein